MLMTPEAARELAKIYDNVETLFLETLQDGQWHDLASLRQQIPSELATTTYDPSGSSIDPREPDRDALIRSTYQGFLARRVVDALVRQGRCQTQYEGGTDKVRLALQVDTTAPSRRQPDTSAKTKPKAKRSRPAGKERRDSASPVAQNTRGFSGVVGDELSQFFDS